MKLQSGKQRLTMMNPKHPFFKPILKTPNPDVTILFLCIKILPPVSSPTEMCITHGETLYFFQHTKAQVHRGLQRP